MGASLMEGSKGISFKDWSSSLNPHPFPFATPSPRCSICLRTWEWIGFSLSELPGDTLGKFSGHSRRPMWSRPGFPQHRQSIVLEGCWSAPSAGHGFHSSSYTWGLCPSLDHGAGGLCEISSVVDPRSPSLTTNTDSCHGLPRPSPRLQRHSSPTTLHHQQWAHDTYHFSCLAFSGVCSSSCASI